MVRDGESFRFVPFKESKGVKPLWSVNFVVHDRGSVSWNTDSIVPKPIRRESRWTYELATLRFDPDWQADKDNPLSLPDEDVRRLRPLVVAELNRRDPAAKLGDRLDSLLTDGLSATSYICPQNAVILLGWLSLPMALVRLCAMLVRRRPQPPAN